MNLKELLHLIDRYRSGKATQEETRVIEDWYARLEQEDPHLSIDQKAKEQKIWDAMMQDPALSHWSKKNHTGKPRRNLRLWWAAACFLMIGGLSWMFFQGNKNAEVTQDIAALHDLRPGGNAATLILEDGSVIDLNSINQGGQIALKGLELTKTADGELSYKTGAETNKPAIRMHTISTPRGGQYKVILPDSTVVWLNAASKLKYPSRFSADTRTVYLSGEAYFEVQKIENKGKRTPFYVQTSNQRIAVLGTHFNVKAYAKEDLTTTTLLEGAVRVTGYSNGKPSSSERILKVGEQSRWQHGELAVTEANLEKTIAWKNGKFIFTGENIRTIMDDISRWYDIDVEYKGDLSKINFEGSLSRYENMVEFLRKLELTGTVQFEIISSGPANQKERRILVMP